MVGRSTLQFTQHREQHLLNIGSVREHCFERPVVLGGADGYRRRFYSAKAPNPR